MCIVLQTVLQCFVDCNLIALRIYCIFNAGNIKESAAAKKQEYEKANGQETGSQEDKREGRHVCMETGRQADKH